MFCSIEILYHYRCEQEGCGAWFNVADRKPGKTIVCPECGVRSEIREMQNGQGEQVSGVAWVRAAKVRPPIVLDSEND